MKKVIIALILLMTINVNAAVGTGGSGISAVGTGNNGISAVGTGGSGISAVGTGSIGVTQLGNGYIQVCTADAQKIVSCIITKG